MVNHITKFVSAFSLLFLVAHTVVKSQSLHDVIWTEQIGVSTSGNILTKNIPVSNWNNAGAVSSNLLVGNTNGHLEFSPVSGSDFMVGLAVNNTINQNQFNYALYVNSSATTLTAFEGGMSTAVGSWSAGDLISISREGSTVKYFRNGTAIRTITVDPSLELKVKTTIYLSNKSTTNIRTSFDAKLILNSVVEGLAGNTGSGNISVNVVGGTLPYSYSWSTGEQTSSINNKPQGTYSLTVTDATSRTQSRTFNLGYKVNWTNTIGVAVNGITLTKTSPVSNWNNAGGVSTNILPANTDGWIEFPTQSYSDFIVGVSANNTINWNQFSNAFYVNSSSNALLSYEGETTTQISTWQAGDVLSIKREGNSVKYYRNGQVIRTLTINPTLELKVKVTIQLTGRSTTNINTSFWSSDGIPRTYYAITSGQWTNPSTWSLADGGAPASVYPDAIDNVVVKGYTVIIGGDVKCAGLSINSTNSNTAVEVEGPTASLIVKGNVIMTGQSSTPTDLLLVRNGGRLDIKNP